MGGGALDRSQRDADAGLGGDPAGGAQRAPGPGLEYRRGGEADLDRQRGGAAGAAVLGRHRSEEHTSELQSLMRSSYAVFCLKKKKTNRKVIEGKENNSREHA